MRFDSSANTGCRERGSTTSPICLLLPICALWLLPSRHDGFASKRRSEYRCRWHLTRKYHPNSRLTLGRALARSQQWIVSCLRKCKRGIAACLRRDAGRHATNSDAWRRSFSGTARNVPASLKIFPTAVCGCNSMASKFPMTSRCSLRPKS
jgi:hypothetical protein